MMKAEFLNPFIKSVVEVIESNVGEAPVKGKVYLRGGYPYSTREVAVIIGITGSLTGQVVISLCEDAAKYIAARMLMEEKVYELDEYAQSALGELANMVTANATIGLADAGYESNITPPSVITGRSMEVSCRENIPTITIPLTINGSDLELNLSVIENSEG